MAEKEEPGEIEMGKGEFIQEHRKLTKVLRKGTRQARVKEARKQSRELRKHTR